jgi:hypothetical protein
MLYAQGITPNSENVLSIAAQRLKPVWSGDHAQVAALSTHMLR